MLGDVGFPGANLPCDKDDRLDVYDWNRNNIWGEDEDNIPPPGYYDYPPFEGTSLVSTCIGCGIRQATDVLKSGGRPQSLWVIIFLTDGVANVSDTHNTFGEIPSSFTYGFCGMNDAAKEYGSYMGYVERCKDETFEPRHCIDADASTCPPGAIHVSSYSSHYCYSVEDYARDMTDRAALLYTTNPNEPNGEDIIIYTIALGPGAVNGAPLLRYMANIGDDGARENDACLGFAATDSCGNYYYAPTGAYLDRVFESVASRIFTKISR